MTRKLNPRKSEEGRSTVVLTEEGSQNSRWSQQRRQNPQKVQPDGSEGSISKVCYQTQWISNSCKPHLILPPLLDPKASEFASRCHWVAAPIHPCQNVPLQVKILLQLLLLLIWMMMMMMMVTSQISTTPYPRPSSAASTCWEQWTELTYQSHQHTQSFWFCSVWILSMEF